MKTEANMRSGGIGSHIFVGDGLGAPRIRFRAPVQTGMFGSMRKVLILMVAGTLAAIPIGLSAEMTTLSLAWSRSPLLPEQAGIGGCFAGTSGDALLVAGGSNFPGKRIWEGGQKAWQDRVFVRTKTDGNWQRAGKLPQPLAFGGSVTTEQGLVCIGGADSERHYAEVFALSWSKRGLRTKALPSLPMPLAYATGAAMGDKIYVAGGTTKPGEASASGKFLVLDLSNRKPTWQKLEPCPGKPRLLAVPGVLGGAFNFGGSWALVQTGEQIQREYLHDFWRDRPNHAWQRLANLPKPSSAGATPAPTFKSTLFVIGGDDGSLAGFQPMENHPDFSRTILAYDAISDTWSRNGEAPTPNATVQTVFWQGRFIFPAGEPRPGIRVSDVWTLDVSAGN